MKTKNIIRGIFLIFIVSGSIFSDILPLFYASSILIINKADINQQKIQQKNKNWTMSLNTREIKISGEQTSSSFLISLRSDKKKYSVKKWTVVIYREQNSQKQMIRSFTGSDIIPSTIQWKGRDYSDVIVSSGSYSIQAIVIENTGNTIAFSPEKITILP